MPRYLATSIAAMLILLASGVSPGLDDPAAARRRQQAQDFHLRAQERTGVLVPMYVYRRTYTRTRPTTGSPT